MDARMMDGAGTALIMIAVIIAVVALGVGVLVGWWIA